MTQLDLFFADRYFKALDLYLHGRLDSLPRCWTYSFEAVRAGRTMVVQDIVLQIVPRVVYDLPILWSKQAWIETSTADLMTMNRRTSFSPQSWTTFKS